jgi:hypothetical protein
MAERPDIKRAIDFLVATQNADGSWLMTSRSTPDGRPGSAKLLTPITWAATSWTTLGLARLVRKQPYEGLPPPASRTVISLAMKGRESKMGKWEADCQDRPPNGLAIFPTFREPGQETTSRVSRLMSLWRFML